MYKRFKIARRTLRLIGIATSLMLAASVASAYPDLSGIWQTPKEITQLKTTEGKAPPLNSTAAKLYSARRAQFRQGDKSFDPSVTLCKPPGSPRILYQPFPIEIVQTAKQIFFTYQWNRLYRIVDIDSANAVIAPTYFGTSNASWNGNALEIDVQGLHDDTLLDAAGLPHSDALHLTERYQLQDHGKELLATIRIDDPKIFTKPWDTKVTLKKLATDRLGEDVCEERVGLVK